MKSKELEGKALNAIKSGNLIKLRRAIIKLNKTNDAGIIMYRALELACEYGHMNILKYVIENKDIKDRFEIQKNIWNVASGIGVNKNSIPMLNFLIDEKYLDFTNDENRRCLLICACFHNNLELIKELLENKKMKENIQKFEYDYIEAIFEYRLIQTKPLIDYWINIFSNDKKIIFKILNVAMELRKEEEANYLIIERKTKLTKVGKLEIEHPHPKYSRNTHAILDMFAKRDLKLNLEKTLKTKKINDKVVKI